MQRILALTYLLLCCIMHCNAASIVQSPRTFISQRKQQLNQLNHSIAHIKAQLSHDQQLRINYQKKLKMTELATAQIQAKLNSTHRQLTQQQRRLITLQQKSQQYRHAIATQQAFLAQQIRAAYLLPQSPFLKLLLNQTDSSNISRLRMYYHYLTQNEVATIQQLHTNILQLRALQLNSQHHWRVLKALQRKRQQQHRTLAALKVNRTHIVSQINGKITTNSQRLTQLIHDKDALTQMIRKLQRTKVYTATSRFDRLKGKLPWPVNGRVITQFGAKIYHSELRWSGVVLAAQTNQAVHVIAAGTVIFADWLAGYGLLLIVNHGNGYMSLYGRNQSLYKRVGDLVQPGEVIATVGKSGGYENSGLYFEIRDNAKPLNPLAWCHKRVNGVTR